MKKLIAILVIMFIGISAYSQYLVDGLKWNNSNPIQWEGWSVYTNFTYKVEGDTIINNNVYKIVKNNIPDVNNNWNSFLFVREDNQSWFFKKRNSNDEVKLYDFSVNVGDIIPQYDFADFDYLGNKNVTAIDTITLENGEIRKKITIENGWDVWVEGIGSVIFILDMPISNMMDIPFFLCASEGNNLLYIANEDLNCYNPSGLNDISNDVQMSIYPNPANSFLNVTSQDKINYIVIYNPLGKRVYQTKVNKKSKSIDIDYLSKGIYILGVNTDKGYIKKKFIKN